jgi:hypothetical protein
MRLFICILCGITLNVAAPPVLAEDVGVPMSNPALNDRFFFYGGAYIPKSATSAQLNSTKLGLGTNIDLEQTLGIQTQKGVPDAGARWRISERWRVEAEYFQLNRDGDRTIDRDIQWGDQVFPVNSHVVSQFDVSDTRISAGYSFFKRPDKELGAGFGLHVLKYSMSLSSTNIGAESNGVTAPLPVLSLYGQFALTDHWAIGSRIDWLSLSYNQYSGSITSLSADLMYQPFRHFGFGLAYRSLFIHFESTNSNFTGKVDQSFQGPLLYVNASF